MSASSTCPRRSRATARSAWWPWRSPRSARSCLAMLFASLSRRMPADGGPYAYARAAFGNLVGFSNAWLYWIPAWAGNAAIATGWVLYVERFVNTGHGTAGTIVLTLAGIWAAAAINLRGIRSMGQIQLWTSVLKFLPAARDVDDRALLHRPRQLHAVQPQRPGGTAGDRQRDGAVPVLLHRCRVGLGRGGQGAQTPPATSPGPRSSAPSPRRASTCSRSSRSSASCPTSR